MPKKNVLTQASNRLNGAVGKAFDRVHTMVGVPVDPVVRMYDKLRPEDFQKLERKFGRDVVVEYVEDMEKNKIMEED